MTDVVSHLAPRSVAATADFELLRVARTDLDEPETAASLTLAGRIRGIADLRVPRIHRPLSMSHHDPWPIRSRAVAAYGSVIERTANIRTNPAARRSSGGMSGGGGVGNSVERAVRSRFS